MRLPSLQGRFVGKLRIDHDVDRIRQLIELGVERHLEEACSRNVAKQSQSVGDLADVLGLSCAEEDDVPDQTLIPRVSGAFLLLRVLFGQGFANATGCGAASLTSLACLP